MTNLFPREAHHPPFGDGGIPKVYFSQSGDATILFISRILEFENPHVTSNTKGTGCEFELWDCGGDPKYVSFKEGWFHQMIQDSAARQAPWTLAQHTS